MPLTPQQKRKLEKLKSIRDKGGDVAVTEHLIEVEDILHEIVDRIETVDLTQMEQVQRLAESVLTNMRGLDGKDGVDGKDGLDGKDGRDGRDGRDGVDGKDGRDGIDGLNGLDGLNGADGKDAVVDYEQISLLALEGFKELEEEIPMSAVKDLNATIATLQNRTQLLNQIATQGQRSSPGTSGSSTFLGLTDTPSSYSGAALKVIRVNAGENALEFVSLTGGGDALTTDPLSQFASTTSLQLKGVMSDETGSGALVFADTPTLVTPVLGEATGTGLTLSGLTASEIVITNGSKKLVSAPVATYPSLTELTYVKGVTSAIQTQLNARVLTTSFVDNEEVSGSGTTFTLANTPIAGSEHVYALGQRLKVGVSNDYTISGAVITTASSWSAGDLVADYRK